MAFWGVLEPDNRAQYGWKASAPVIIYRAESDLQADAGVCFVGVEAEAQQVVLVVGTDGKLSPW
jgi:hypothetical protein